MITQYSARPFADQAGAQLAGVTNCDLFLRTTSAFGGGIAIATVLAALLK
jgi:hypothetical protein